MMSLIGNTKQTFFISVFLAVGLLVLPFVSGCARTQHTTQETQVVSTTPADPQALPVETTTTHTQTSTATKSDSPGILGGAFNFIGAILAFPFKLIGGVIEAIF